MDSIKSDPRFQYAYTRSPLYCLIDIKITEITSCGFWMDLDGDLSAPECLPVGCSYGRDKNGARFFKNFVPRGWTLEEEKRRNDLADRLIDELLVEMAAEKMAKNKLSIEQVKYITV